VSLYRLWKDGWFGPKKDVELDLTDEQINLIKDGRIILTQKDGKYYWVYLRRGYDLKNLKESDLRIEEW
jgi:hypothetical protein